MNNFNYKNLTPFKWFVLENFPFIENDFEAINNYRLFSKVVEYLNKTIDSMNLTGEQMENVTNAMTELQNYVNQEILRQDEDITEFKNYVTNYLENLDVQEEINNKLDDMVEDGTLERIINQEILGNINNNIKNFASVIREIPFISVNLDENYFYGSNGMTTYNDGINDFIVVQNADSLDGNHKSLYKILNLDTEEITSIYKDYGDYTSHGCSFFTVENYMYLLEQTGANARIRKFLNLNMDSELIFTNLTLHGLTYKDNNFWGLVRNSDTNYSIVKLSNDFQTITETHNFVLNRNNIILQNFKYINGFFYLVHSNGLIKIDSKNYIPIMSYTSGLIEGEYEDIISLNDNIYILINCGNESPSFAIVDSNINPKSVSKNHLFAFGSTLHVNSSKNGFYESGYDANTAIHSSLWASYWGASYGFNKYTIDGDCRAFKFKCTKPIEITGNDHKIKLGPCDHTKIHIINAIIEPYTNIHSHITSSWQTYVDFYFEKVSFPTTDGNSNPAQFNYHLLACKLIIRGVTDLLNCSIDTTTFHGSTKRLSETLMIINLETGITENDSIYQNSQFTRKFIQELMNACSLKAEIATTANGTPTSFIVLNRYYNHLGSMFGFGINASGENIIVNLSDEKIATCKVNGQKAYLKRLYVNNA